MLHYADAFCGFVSARGIQLQPSEHRTETLAFNSKFDSIAPSAAVPAITTTTNTKGD